jgi:hypothetical protein
MTAPAAARSTNPLRRVFLLWSTLADADTQRERNAGTHAANNAVP